MLLMWNFLKNKMIQKYAVTTELNFEFWFLFLSSLVFLIGYAIPIMIILYFYHILGSKEFSQLMKMVGFEGLVQWFWVVIIASEFPVLYYIGL